MERKSSDKNKDVFSFDNMFVKFTNSFNVLLGITSTVYALGFLMWAIYAWNNGLGYLPAIREQNLVAGIIPLFIILITYLIITHIAKYIILACTWIAKGSKYGLLKVLLLILIVAGFIFLFIKPYAKYAVIVLLSCGWLFSILRGDKDSVNSGAFLATIYIKIACVFGSLSLLLGYLAIVFPRIPQDFGGPKPILVQLDIVRENISPQTQKIIFQSQQIADTQDIVRTADLYLLFEGNDYLLLRKSLARKDSSYSLLKIKTESVKGIFEPASSNKIKVIK